MIFNLVCIQCHEADAVVGHLVCEECLDHCANFVEPHDCWTARSTTPCSHCVRERYAAP